MRLLVYNTEGKISENFSLYIETQSAAGTQNKLFSTQAVY